MKEKRGRPKTENPITQKSFSVRCPLELYEKLALAAKDDGRTVASYARRVLEQHLNN